MVRRKDGPSDGGWTFVTSHLVVLLCIAGDPTVRISEVAERTGITVRAVVGILSDLVDEGYLIRTRVGRRNHYSINRDMPLRHLETQHRRVGELLALLESASPDEQPPPRADPPPAEPRAR